MFKEDVLSLIEVLDSVYMFLRLRAIAVPIISHLPRIQHIPIMYSLRPPEFKLVDVRALDIGFIQLRSVFTFDRSERERRGKGQKVEGESKVAPAGLAVRADGG